MGIITRNLPFNRSEFLFFMQTEIKSGAGKIETMASDLQIEDDLAVRNSVMIFTDNAIVAAGLLEKVKRGLLESPYEIKAVFDEIPSDSDVELIGRAAANATEVEANPFIALAPGR